MSTKSSTQITYEKLIPQPKSVEETGLPMGFLADLVLKGRFPSGSRIRATKKGDELAFERDRRRSSRAVEEETAEAEPAEPETEGESLSAEVSGGGE